MIDPVGKVRAWGAEPALRALFGALCRAKVTGLDCVPRSGPLLVACNHVSVIDPPLLAWAVSPVRHPRFLGKRELFENWASGWFLRQLGSIPLDRGGIDVGALKGALDVLADGGSIGIFPEGTRARPGQTLPPKLGVSFLAAKTRAFVVPARVLGTRDFPRGGRLEVRFGSPLAAPAEGREAASSFARAVMDAIGAL